MKTSLLGTIAATILVLVVACAPPPTRPPQAPPPPHHTILDSNGWGWPASTVTVLSDIEINSLRVRHVRTRSAECKDGYSEHLELSGPIGPDSSEVLDRILQRVTLCRNANSVPYSPEVYLNSNGGLLKHGYLLGQTFAKFQAHTFITGGQQCASSCAIAFLGGKYRTILYDGRLLFHSPFVRAGGTIACSTRDESQDMKTYIESFLGPKDGAFVFDRAMAYCGQGSAWTLNADAARLLGITTDKRR